MVKMNDKLKRFFSFDNLQVLFCAIILILNSGYYRFTINDSLIPVFLLIAYTIFIVVYNRKLINFRTIVCVPACMLTIGFICSSIANYSINTVLAAGKIFVIMICSFIIFLALDCKKISRYLLIIIEIEILLAAILFLIINVLHIKNLPLVKSRTGISYYDFFIVTQISTANRACGCFWEPGVFSSIICFVFLLNLLFNKIKIYNLLILTVGVALTFSTAGLIIYFILLFGYLLKILKGKMRYAAIGIFSVMFVVFLVFEQQIVTFLGNEFPTIFGKFLSGDKYAVSFETRYRGPLVNLSIFLDSPLFGFGFRDSAAKYLQLISENVRWHVDSQTSTSTQIMSSIGIFGVFYSIPAIAFIFRKNEKSDIFDRIIVCVVFLLIVNKEPHINFALTWFVFAILCLFEKKNNTKQKITVIDV